MAGRLTCPKCGADNPRSMLVTLCHNCKADLAEASAAIPATAGVVTVPTPAPQKTAPPPPPAAGGVVTLRTPAPPQAAPPVPARETPAAPATSGRVACTRCGFLNRAAAVVCARCRAPLPGARTADLARSDHCPRCGHDQTAGRITCEKCGMHFVGGGTAASTVLPPTPLSRAPRSQAEQTTGAVLGCLFGSIVVLVILFRVIAALQ